MDHLTVQCPPVQLFHLLTPLSFSSSLGLTPHSKVWVGAWWIGFVFMAAFCLLLAIPILAYPRALPGSEKLEKVSEAHRGDTDKQKQPFTKIKEIPKALAVLLKNPTFFFLNLAGASEGLVISGFAVFLPKLIENQFSVTAVWSALLMGRYPIMFLSITVGNLQFKISKYLIVVFDFEEMK